jgi:hypothetical protein
VLKLLVNRNNTLQKKVSRKNKNKEYQELRQFVLKLLVDGNRLFVYGPDGPGLSDSSPRENIDRLHHLAVGILCGCAEQADVSDLDLCASIGTAISNTLATHCAHISNTLATH